MAHPGRIRVRSQVSCSCCAVAGVSRTLRAAVVRHASLVQTGRPADRIVKTVEVEPRSTTQDAVPESTTEGEFETLRLQLEQRLWKLKQDAEARFSRVPEAGA